MMSNCKAIVSNHSQDEQNKIPIMVSGAAKQRSRIHMIVKLKKHIVLSILLTPFFTFYVTPQKFARDIPFCNEFAQKLAQVEDAEKSKITAVKLEILFGQQSQNHFFTAEEQKVARKKAQCLEIIRNYKMFYESQQKYKNFFENFASNKSKEEYFEEFITKTLDSHEELLKVGLITRKKIINDLRICIQERLYNQMSSTLEANQAREWKDFIETKSKGNIF